MCKPIAFEAMKGTGFSLKGTGFSPYANTPKKGGL